PHRAVRPRADALRRAAVVVLVAASLFALAALPAGAGVDPPPTTADANPNAPRLVLTGQPAWVTVGGNLPLRLQVRGQAAGAAGPTAPGWPGSSRRSSPSRRGRTAGRPSGSASG